MSIHDSTNSVRFALISCRINIRLPSHDLFDGFFVYWQTAEIISRMTWMSQLFSLTFPHSRARHTISQVRKYVPNFVKRHVKTSSCTVERSLQREETDKPAHLIAEHTNKRTSFPILIVSIRSPCIVYALHALHDGIRKVD